MTISNITEAKTCTVTFAIKTYTVNVSVTNGSSNYSSRTVNHGSNTTFTITPSSGYKLDGATVSGTGCSLSGSTLTVSNVTSARTCTVKITAIDITSTKYLYGKILADHPTVKVRNDFDDRYPDGAYTITSGVIYKETSRIETTIGNLPVYYFARRVADNWVSFAGLTWRILRTNEDGSIRLIYHAKLPTNSPDYFNMKFSDDAWGDSYMYGTNGTIQTSRTNTKDSVVKVFLEKWYEDNIKSSYDKYINYNTLFCVDRSNNGKGWEGRLRDWKPSFKCGQSATDAMNNDASSDDLFSASTASKGNKKLKYPIGLFTGDEASYMGYYGRPGHWYASGVPVYLIEDSSGSASTSSPKLWTMSPGGTVSICGEEECSTKYQVVEGYVAEGTGLTSYVYPPTSANRGVKPVISLKSCVTWSSGNGTASNPYQVSISSSCSSAVN